MGKALIGNRQHAAIALRGPLWDDEDWFCFSGGGMRDVWLHRPSGVVYKTDGYNSRNHYPDYANRVELQNARYLRRLDFKNVYIPLVSGFRFDDELVIAMEYIESEPPSSAAARRAAVGELMRHTGLSDLHGGNWLLRGDFAVPIDMGCPMYRHNHPRVKA